MNGTASAAHAGSSEPTPNDPMAVLWQHDRHVLVFTRAGKPVFSQHGDEQQLSPLCALLQVLLHMDDGEGGDGEQNGGSSPPALRSEGTASSAVREDGVRQITYYRSLPTPGQACYQDAMNAQVQALTLFFFVPGELIYFMAVRSVVSSSPTETVDMPSAEEFREPPPESNCCLALLRHVHHCILLVLPNVNALLARTPGLDIMSTYTSADRAALRELIESYQTELTYAVGAVATLALSVEKRQVVEDALLRCYRSCADAAVGRPAHQLFSYLYYGSYLVAAVGPPETYAPDPRVDMTAPLALGPDTAFCGGLHVDDALLLYRYARSLVSRQQGEAWVPVCLPCFNSTGYLWCYAVNFTQYVRELRQLQGMTVWPRLWEAHTKQDVLLLHVSAAQDDFLALSRSTRRYAELLYAPTVGEDFYYRLEEELCYCTPAPLTELLSWPHVSLSARSLSSASDPPGGLPLWYGVVLQGGDATFLNASKGEDAKASKRAHRPPSSSIRLLLESRPSPLLNITTVEDIREFRQLVAHFQAQLRAIPAPSSAPCMMFVRHNSGVAFAVVQPTAATLRTLADHFFSPHNPFKIPLDIPAAGEGAGEALLERRRGVSSSTWVQAVHALGATELTAVFAASTPEATAWYWVAHLLFMAVQRRRRFVVRQLIGAGR
ncbi:hypothetical protein JKF63_01626 [Porcisia hertigi]|uniref:FUZ/MON1/HPS1 second Longin domain-containing protein n=1 Tax=Porcisia hertigi TaxID=2761500 RepID=A0A836HLH8_9TRYP|nr:hypothetical protein JKF63_01626 [Porcisia hertigi]